MLGAALVIPPHKKYLNITETTATSPSMVRFRLQIPQGNLLTLTRRKLYIIRGRESAGKRER